MVLHATGKINYQEIILSGFRAPLRGSEAGALSRVTK